ncbi:MAG: hypothetical protein RBQ81_01085 [Arcobacteraceae bacterium]|jgi:hypothetical protein|nr:hypothetical protein [Arcobacteraceae bacterium]
MDNKQREKEELLEEIQELISCNSEDCIDINKDYLKYLDIDELIDIRDMLLRKKIYLKEETISWFDELYEKTKKDTL